jgi:hypothetical protein
MRVRLGLDVIWIEFGKAIFQKEGSAPISDEQKLKTQES